MWDSQSTSDFGHSINIIQLALDVLFSVKEIQMSREGVRDVVEGADSFWSARVDLASAEQSQCS